MTMCATVANAQSQARTQVELPAQSLSSALNRVGRQTGTEIVFVPSLVRGLRAPAVSGAFTIEQTLDRLLAGTDLRYRRTPTGAYVVEAAGALGRTGAVQGAVGGADDEDQAMADQGHDIVVTGSRIRSRNLTSVVPVTSVAGGEFLETGQTAIGDVLNDLPALRSTVSQSNSSRLLGTPGINQLDLRGLGVNRTLVLQNGRRLISGSPDNTAPDVNTIPTDLIERIDIVTGGSSAIYGSDAMAGVVNFVLKRDYEGIQLRAQSGISPHGDAQQYDASLLAGTNFADGRGNIAINLQYTKQEDWYASQRPAYREVGFFIPVDSDPPPGRRMGATASRIGNSSGTCGRSASPMAGRLCCSTSPMRPASSRRSIFSRTEH